MIGLSFLFISTLGTEYLSAGVTARHGRTRQSLPAIHLQESGAIDADERRIEGVGELVASMHRPDAFRIDLDVAGRGNNRLAGGRSEADGIAADVGRLKVHNRQQAVTRTRE